MKNVYEPRTKAFVNDDGMVFIHAPESITVHDNDPDIDSGLLDSHGRKLYRCVAWVPIGFHNK